MVHRRLLRQCPLLRVPADGCLRDVEDGRAAVGWGVGAQHRLYWGNPPARAEHQMLRFPRQTPRAAPACGLHARMKSRRHPCSCAACALTMLLYMAAVNFLEQL